MHPPNPKATGRSLGYSQLGEEGTHKNADSRHRTLSWGLRVFYFCINRYKTRPGAVAAPDYLSVQGLTAGQPLPRNPQPPFGSPSLEGCGRGELNTPHPAPTLIKCLSRGQNPGNPAPVSLFPSQTRRETLLPQTLSISKQRLSWCGGVPFLNPKGSSGSRDHSPAAG